MFRSVNEAEGTAVQQSPQLFEKTTMMGKALRPPPAEG